MGAKFTICCCHFYLNPNRDEKKAILRVRTAPPPRPPEPLSSEPSDSDPEEESLIGREPSEWNLRGNRQSQRGTCDPRAGANVRRESDRELQAFISMRDQADKATEEWEKLNYDIHTLRYAKREVRSRWKKILLQLGYQYEVDDMLYVNKQRRISRDQEHLTRATELLKQLLEHTSLFPPGTEPKNRYLYVMDSLVSLDSAEEFVRLAKEKYPKQ
ncbi:putative melanoregulin-like [Scophthalmus maximus]|uniref:Putative melanoregulin-like n=1 Tax=Scophthalmus maximus TaxID=52904 RepID=A0A2U9C8C4_SCOMX|nr:melanoregulin-like isoform X2 [Scophthalmus maximus]AWP12861.1 putative melanoregulin-like [Scophthalmus maximus]